MVNADLPPTQGRRITLHELLLSVLLFAFGMGLFRLLKTIGDYAETMEGSANLYPFAGLCGVLGLFAIGAGIAISSGRLVFASRRSVGDLVFIGGIMGIMVGLFSLCLLAPVFSSGF
jgi:hypothetical protein